MIYLILAIVSSALLSIIMRISEKHVKGNVSMLAFNYVMCLIMAVFYTGVGSLFPTTEGIGLTTGLGLFNGCLYVLGFVLLQVNVKKNGVVLSTTFMKLGLLVPIAMSVFFFKEVPELFQLIGFLIAVASIILINFEKEQTTMQFRAGLILLLVLGGLSDGMSKVYEEIGNPALSENFLLYTFASAVIVCSTLAFVKRERPGKAELLWGLLIGVPNYFSARFLLRALEHIPAVIVYPTFSVGTIVVVTLAGVCIFKERLGKRQWIAIGSILVALVLLNL